MRQRFHGRAHAVTMLFYRFCSRAIFNNRHCNFCGFFGKVLTLFNQVVSLKRILPFFSSQITAD